MEEFCYRCGKKLTQTSPGYLRCPALFVCGEEVCRDCYKDPETLRELEARAKDSESSEEV